MADDGNGWTVMLDYRTFMTPSKRPMKLPTLSLAKVIIVEWEYQVLTLVYLFSQFSSFFFSLVAL
jgi:chaperone required for assembly of F1-ATPase